MVLNKDDRQHSLITWFCRSSRHVFYVSLSFPGAHDKHNCDDHLFSYCAFNHLRFNDSIISGKGDKGNHLICLIEYQVNTYKIR